MMSTRGESAVAATSALLITNADGERLSADSPPAVTP